MGGGTGVAVCTGKQLEDLGHWRTRLSEERLGRKGQVPKTTSSTLQFYLGLPGFVIPRENLLGE